MELFAQETRSSADDDLESNNESSSSGNDDEMEQKWNNNKRKTDLHLPANKRLRFDLTVNGEVNKQKNDFRKAPSAEELTRLRETENLFKSNLFRMQIEGMLTEIDIKQKYKKMFDVWFSNFTEFINVMPELEVKLSKLLKHAKRNNMNKKATILSQVGSKITVQTDQDLVVKLLKPDKCEVFGLNKINSAIGPELHIDLNLTMSKNSFLEKDYLNNRYLVKHECYLWYIYFLLSKTELFSQVSVEENSVLQIQPKVSSKLNIRLHVTPSENSFKLSRFEPDQNNIRKNLYRTFKNIDSIGLKETGTPYYNSVLLQDLTLVPNYSFAKGVLKHLKNIQDGIKLLLIWLRKRDLHLNGFSDILLVQTVVYLTLKKKINKHMSSYQVIRNFWMFLDTSNWHDNPISLCEDIKPATLKNFSENFDVVFLDISGSYNLAAFLYLDVYMKVKKEASLAVQFLDDNKLDSFQSLFMTQMSPAVQYDVLLSLNDSDGFKMVVDKIEKNVIYKYMGCYHSLIIKHILKLLKIGLNKRVHYVVPLRCEQNESQSLTSIMFGLTLDPQNAFRIIEKGPSSNTPEAKAFQVFWENLAESRRFADGSICEAVYFPTQTFQERRRIFKTILNHVITKKLKVEKYEIVADECDEMVVDDDYVAPFPTGTCEEGSLKVIAVFDELSKKLKSFTLPLDITSIQGASEVFSYTSVFPPIPTNYKWGGKMTGFKENNITLKEDGKLRTVPEFVEAIECVIQLGMNSKWPNDLQAFRQLKIGFYLELSKLLEKEEIVSNTKPDYLDVFYQGLVFRFRLYHPKELSIIKRYTKADTTIAYKDTEESIRIEKSLNILPKIIGALNGIQSQNPSFGPSTTFIKRWLRSQLMDEYHIPDVVISLINASLYLNSAPFEAANLPQVAFGRFLQYLSNFDWNLHYIVVNFNDELTKEDLNDFETKFQESRQNYPLLFILTSFDEGKSMFTKKCIREVLNRLSLLAKASYQHLLCSIAKRNLIMTVKELFIPNLDGYNLLIYLKDVVNPRRHQQLQCVKSLSTRVQLELYDKKKSTKMPVVDFNPVEIYLRELWENYGDFALFFYDPYGGNVIGVLWKPKVSNEFDFKATQAEGMKLAQRNKLIFNVAALIEDFHILGAGIVNTIKEQ